LFNIYGTIFRSVHNLILKNRRINRDVPGVNFINALWAAFTHADPKSTIKYRWPSLYAVFLSAISSICDPEMTFFSGTYPLIISHPWSFYIQIHYMRVYFWSPYLSHITRSNCTVKSSVFFALFGSARAKAALRMLMKLTPVVKFIKTL